MKHQRILVTDFDGTMTRTDFFHFAREVFPSAADHDYWQDRLDGKLTHFEGLSALFRNIRTDWKGMEQALDRMELDPRLPDSVEQLQEAGWKIIVASAGCEWYIRRLLDRAGVSLEIHAIPGVFSPESGLVMHLPENSPYLSMEFGIDKAAIVRNALKKDPFAAFAGDSGLDIPAAELVDPSVRFARHRLLAHFKNKAEECRHFEWWSDIAGALLEPWK